MEFTKEQTLQLKKLIKEKVQEQKSLKPQRKTVYFTGTRTTSPGMAVAQHRENRYLLRHYYIVYGLMKLSWKLRDRHLDQAVLLHITLDKLNYKFPYNDVLITKLIEEYGGKEALRASA